MSKPIQICKVDDCSKRCYGRGFCTTHYARWRNHGNPLTVLFRVESHGMHGTPEYRSWNAMKNRCYQVSNNNYRHYGARGIEVCIEWRDSFAAFYKSMGNKPSPKHTLDRINNDGNYEPGNCRWAMRIQQANNTSRNRYITIQGVTKTFTEWVRYYDRRLTTVQGRYYRLGWPIERALDI